MYNLTHKGTTQDQQHCPTVGPEAFGRPSQRDITTPITRKKSHAFEAKVFLNSSGVARKPVEYRRSEKIYSQGEPATTVMYVQKGDVNLSVVSALGKEAIVALLGPGDFLGEGCLTGLPFRTGTATAITPSTILVIEKNEMIRILHREHKFSDRFISYMLSRNIRVEEDLLDQLFNSAEKRLARALLLLARYGKQDQPQRILPTISQEALAEMIGTTRSRVNVFLNKFKKQGFIHTNGGLHINSSLLSVVLRD
jgi:CRP/FNR family transcriptional regulator, cyclic AMP receptor protein